MGGFPAVLPRRGQPPIPAAGRRVWLIKASDPGSENEGSFVGDQGLPSKLGLLSRGEPERASEGGDNDCSESGNTDAVPLNEQARIGYIRNNDGAITGWIFFGRSIGFVILLLIYAAMKEWR